MDKLMQFAFYAQKAYDISMILSPFTVLGGHNGHTAILCRRLT
jgi:hypothetical protein